MGETATGRKSRTYRAALAAVIILSALLVVAVIAVVAGFVRQYRLYRADQAGAGMPAGVRLEPGAHILSATTEAGKLVLHVQTPEGGAVEIIDLSTGKLVSEVKEGK